MRASTRRRFLRLGALGAISSLTRIGKINAFAQTANDYKALVCVYLGGGNDGVNTVVPMSGPAQAAYSQARGGLLAPGPHIPVATVNHSVYGATTYGLNSNLGGVYNIATKGKLAILPNVGTLIAPTTKQQYLNRSVPLPQHLFSHSNQTEQMLSARLDRSSNSGWAGRVADAARSMNGSSVFPTAVSLAGESLFVVGNQTQAAALQPGYRLSLIGSWGGAMAQRDFALQELLDFDNGVAMVQAADQRLSDALEIGDLIAAASSQGQGFSWRGPNSEFGQQMAEVARLIAMRNQLGMRRQIFFVQRTGFDTHALQAWPHGALLREVDEVISEFYRVMEQDLGIADEVTTFTESDFGRSLLSNANGGTDHAWGNLAFVMGGAVRGGVYGAFPLLDVNGPDTIDRQGRFIPTTAIDQYGATLARWFGVPNSQLDSIFPNLRNFAARDLGFMA